MPDDEHASTLWRLSAFDRLHEEALQGLERTTVLSSTLMSELDALERRQESGDALEVFAACLRLHQPALVYLRCGELVWPITVFPVQMLYHSPQALLAATPQSLARVSAITVEPAGVRPPGHAMSERVAAEGHFHSLVPALWRLALHGPRSRLLTEIGGTAAYRVLRNPRVDDLPLPGALGAAAERLRRESASLKQLAEWPGMSPERGARLLNALYLGANLLITRSGATARSEPRASLFGWLGK